MHDMKLVGVLLFFALIVEVNAQRSPAFAEIEKEAGLADVQSVEPGEVEKWRRRTYLSYENFLRQHLTELDRQRRSTAWQRDYSSADAYLRSVAVMRERLKKMLGFWVEPEIREPVKVFDKEVILDEKDFTAYRFGIEVFPGLETYAVEMIPKTAGPHPGLLAQHGYSGTPELVCGLTASANKEDYSYRSLGLRAVRRNFHVIAVYHPSGYGSLEEYVGTLPNFVNYGRCYGKNRLHRMAIMGGGTLFGLDMMASSRGIDLLVAADDVDPNRIGMYGLSQGGQSALFLSAIDERIKASVCSAYFNSRFVKLIGPHRALCFLDSREEDKFFTEVIRYFSDSDIVSLIAPRAFAVEAGQKDTAVDFEKSLAEYQFARGHYEKLGIPKRTEFIAHAQGHISATRRAFEFLMENLQLPSKER